MAAVIHADPRFLAGAAIVLGNAAGTGAAICHALSAMGARVCFIYSGDKAVAERFMAQAGGPGANIELVRTDLAEPLALAACVASLAGCLGPIHSVVYVASPLVPMENVGDITPAQWARAFDADANACFNLIHATLPHVRKSKGSYVAVTSADVTKIPARGSLSAASKAAINMLVLALAKEEGRYGVRANCVAPGWIATERMDGAPPESVEDARKSIPLKRLGSAEEVANVVLFLLSSKASYLTGQVIAVDGGLQI